MERMKELFHINYYWFYPILATFLIIGIMCVLISIFAAAVISILELFYEGEISKKACMVAETILFIFIYPFFVLIYQVLLSLS